MNKRWGMVGLVFLLTVANVASGAVLVEAESFVEKGGWVVDAQFTESMGSPFLLAHGKGTPVADAVATATVPSVGEWRVWVRTRDWTPDYNGAKPGRFQVEVNSVTLPNTLGISPEAWSWVDAGVVDLTSTNIEIRLHDLTGFNGRCDAVFLTDDLSADPPAHGGDALASWRKTMHGETGAPNVSESYDFVVVGGGMAGTAAAISAAEEGLSVALIQDRPVLGGNASDEIRVSSGGAKRHWIVSGISNDGSNRGDASGYDQRRMDLVASYTNIHLFTGWRAYGVETNAASELVAVDARNVESGVRRRFFAPLFADCTGDGWIAYWAGAEFHMGREASSEFNESLAPAVADSRTMGHSLQWTSVDTESPVFFPEVPWALSVSGTNRNTGVPYSATGGDWNWEFGIDTNINSIADAEAIRDHLLRAIYGNFYQAKQNPANANRALDFVPHVSGPRESRRFFGDYIITQNDIQSGVFFEDAVGFATWSIDLHHPTAVSYRSSASHNSAPDWFFPYRALYSRDIPNLFLAGRNISVTHVALGSPRVMNTTAQMGVAVGYAASLCKTYGIEPRDVYRDANRMADLQALIGGAWPERPTPTWTLLDNEDTDNGVAYTGDWMLSTSSDEHYGADYRNDDNAGKGLKTVSYSTSAEIAGLYNISMWWPSDVNRAGNVPVEILTNEISAAFIATDAPWLHNTAPDAVNNSDEMLVGRFVASDYTRGLLSFDLSSIPADAIIADVSLMLTAARRDPASDAAAGGQIGNDGIRIYQVTESFNSTEVTWNSRENGLPWSTVGGTIDATPLATYKGTPYPDGIDAGATIEFNGTGTFQAAVKGALSGGQIDIIVRTPSLESSWYSTKLYRFASESSTNAAWRPRLTVAYMAPGSGISTNIDQRASGGLWNLVGSCNLSEEQPVAVLVRNAGTDGYVMADAVKFELDGYDSSDADNDGLPNWWERWHFLDETTADAYGDADFDGRNNYAEYRCGTDPNDPLSLLTVRGLLGVSEQLDDYVLRWPSITNKTYTVSASTNLATDVFLPVVSNLVATPPENTYTGTVDRTVIFYRVEVE